MIKNKVGLFFIKNKNILYIIVVILCIYLYNKYPLNNKYKYENQSNKCTSENGYIYEESTNKNLIERNTIKSILTTDQTQKLMSLHTIFRPSMMYGTYCNTLYTDYYDFLNCEFSQDTKNKITKDKIKRVRIRHYYFDPDTFFEIKNKNHKIRVLIDANYDILEPDTIALENKTLIDEMLKKIKNGKLKKLFFNEYKRYSYIYKSDPSIRMTIDRNIRVKYLENNHMFNFDILEVKYGLDTPEQVILNYFKEIENLTSTKIIFSDFSKVDYTVDNIIAPLKTVNILKQINW
jgi:hypothetical protein